MEHRKCARCGHSFPATLEFFYRRYGRSEDALLGYCKPCYNQIQKDKHKELKQRLVDYKGGQCVVCSYQKSLAALDFHHLDPSKKEIKIGQTRRTFEKLKREVDKCILVCRNCHAEIHQRLHPQYLVVKDHA